MLTKPQKLFRNVFSLLALYLTVFLVILPQNCLSAAKEGISLCLNTVIPSLFPFFVCSGLLSASGFSALCSRFLSFLMRPLFRLPGASAMTFLLGTVSGYPVGAASAADLFSSGQCTKTEAERMIAFCNNSSPLFVIGVVGTGILGTPSLGYLLYAVHIVSALLVGIAFRFYGKGTAAEARSLPASEPEHNKKTAIFSFGGIIDSAVFSTLKVCGFIVFFSVFAEGIPDGFLKPYICCLTEISGGIKLFARACPESKSFLPMISFFMGFSGISILLQIWSVIAPKGPSAKPLLIGKLIQGILSFLITKILTSLIPITLPVSALAQTDFIEAFSAPDLILSSVLSVFFVVMLLKGAFLLTRSASKS